MAGAQAPATNKERKQDMRYYIKDNSKALAVVHDRNIAETMADSYKRKGHQGVEIIEK